MSSDDLPDDVVVRVEGVRKRFNLHASPARRIANFASFGLAAQPTAHWALSGVDFEVKRGETVGLLGVNGAGKSTLLQMVSGTMTPTDGMIRTRGKVAALLELGAGFQPDFTGRENVRLQLGLAGLDATRSTRLLDWVEDFAEIGERIDRPVRTYSSGMFVRLAFAAAVCTVPEVVVIDEALAVGDVGFQQKCYRHLRSDLAASAKLVVSHDLTSVAAICDRVLLLEGGRIAFDGATEKGIERYLARMAERHHVEPETEADPAGRITIRGADMRVNGADSHIVKRDDSVEVGIDLELAAPTTVELRLVWEDRYRRPTHAVDVSATQVFALEAGRSTVRATFQWPGLGSGQYLLGVEATDRGDPWSKTVSRRLRAINAVATVEYRGPIEVPCASARVEGGGRIFDASPKIATLERSRP